MKRTCIQFLITVGIISSAYSYSNQVDGGITVAVTNVWGATGPFVDVGLYSSDNTMKVIDGGFVTSSNTYIGYLLSASNNQVLAKGGGSVWSNSSHLFVGGEGAGNSLIVMDGGAVKADSSWVGYETNGNNNIAFISGLGSEFILNDLLSIGRHGSLNTMEISHGGLVRNGLGIIAGQESANSNSVLVTGTGSSWENRGNLLVGVFGADSSLHIEDGAMVSSRVGFIGCNKSASNSLVHVKGIGSRWVNTNNVWLGRYSSNNKLVVDDGGGVANRDSILGYDTNSAHNTAIVAGEGSVWTNRGLLRVGYAGSDNQLIINDGAHVYNKWGNVGTLGSASNNSVLVTGSNTLWQNFISIRMGGRATSNGWVRGGLNSSLTIQDNAHVLVGDVDKRNIPTFKYWAGSVLAIGDESSEAFMRLDRGAVVESEHCYIGLGEDEEGHVIVSGAETWWDNYVHLNVGYAGSGNSLLVDRGATVGVGWDIAIGYEAGADGNNITVRGEGSKIVGSRGVKVISRYDPKLYVGRAGSNNRLDILDGGAVSVNDDGFVGERSTAWNNRVFVDGNNSRLEFFWGGLYLGGRKDYVVDSTGQGALKWINGGRNNSLYVGDGGTVWVEGYERGEPTVCNRNYSTISIEPGGQLYINSRYYQDATSVFRFGLRTNSVSGSSRTPLRTGAAELEVGTTFQYSGNVGVLDFDTLHTNRIVEAYRLIVGGVTNATTRDLQVINVDGGLTKIMLLEKEQDIYALFGRRHLAENAGFSNRSQLGRVSGELDDRTLVGDADAIRHLELLNQMTSEQQANHLTQMYAQGTPNHMHRKSIQGGLKQVLVHVRALQQGGDASATVNGAAGPGAESESTMRGWMRGFGQWIEQDQASSSFSAYDQNVYGTVIGFDKAYGNLLVGAAGGYARSELTQENQDSSDAKTRFGILYAAIQGTNWFGDLNVSYGQSDVTTQSGVLPGAEGSFDADNYGVYVGGGKSIDLLDGLYSITPELAFVVNYYAQEEYTVSASSTIEGPYDRWSYQSRLGTSVSLLKVINGIRLIPELRAYWVHEFKADDDKADYSLVGGTESYKRAVQGPEEHFVDAGAGIGVTFNGGVEVEFNLDTQIGEHYEAFTVSGRLVIAF